MCINAVSLHGSEVKCTGYDRHSQRYVHYSLAYCMQGDRRDVAILPSLWMYRRWLIKYQPDILNEVVEV